MIMKRTKTDKKKKLFLFYLTTNNNVYYKVKHETAKKKTLLFNVPKTFLKNVLLYYVLTNTMPIIELDQSD